jgi:hypothetical protein
MNVINNMTAQTDQIAENSPSGSKYVTTSDTSSSDAAIVISAGSTLSTIGSFLYTYPREMITAIGEFFEIDPRVMAVGTAILVFFVALILVSAILKNRI